jgi:hypothetical protein
MKKVFLCVFVIFFLQQSAKSQTGRPYLAIDRQVESYLSQKYSKNYLVAVDPLDTLLVRVRDASKDEEFTDPYGTLKGKMFFQAWQADENDMAIPETKDIFGFSSGGSVLWDSGPLCTSGGAYVLGTSDINNDGKVDVLVSVRDADRDRDYLSYLWIFSWNGRRARILNDVNPNTGQSVLLSGADWYQLFDLKGNGIKEIWAFWDKDNALFPDTLMSTRPYVTYSYNGSLYGLWPNTVQIPSTTDLPANRLSVEPSCWVTQDSSLFNYHYRWSNARTSKQKIRSIFLQDVDQEATMISPTGWLAALPTKSFSAVLWDLQDSQKRQMIGIGQSMGGFGLEDTCLPAIVRYFVKGYAPSSTYWDDEPMPSDAEVLNDLLINSVTGYTIGPKTHPSSIGLLNLLDSLINYTRQSADLGWLGKGRDNDNDKNELAENGIAKNIEQRYQRAKLELMRRDSIQARRELESLVQKIDRDWKRSQEDEQREKRESKVKVENIMTSESYALLKYNTEYLINLLPEKSSKRK